MNLRRVILLFVFSGVALLVFSGLATSAAWGLQDQDALRVNRIYAYRGWQSTDIQLAKGDMYTIRAEGTWLYSPFAGPNGPQGHRRYLAPNFYPLPGVGGGALIGRVGETGQPFYVGGHTSGVAQHNGLLYLRIDDDRLGDNTGYVTLDVTVIKPTPQK